MGIQEYRSVLEQKASELLTCYPAVPIQIGRICDYLGVQITRSDSVQPNKAYMRFSRRLGEKTEIRLSSDSLSPSYARFCVAHEIAHLLVYREFSYTPQSEVEYWKHEAICDEFARTLLAPRAFVARFLRDEWSTRFPITDRARDLARITEIPILQAAARIMAVGTNVFYVVKSFEKRMTISVPGVKGKGREIPIGCQLEVDIQRAKTGCPAARTERVGDYFGAVRLKPFERDMHVNIEAIAFGPNVLVGVASPTLALSSSSLFERPLLLSDDAA